jgi:LysM repeat protein
VNRRRAARYGAPVAFLAAVTAAALLVRAGLQQTSPAKSPAPTVTTLAQTTHAHAPKAGGSREYRVRQGDTFALIAQRLGTTVARLEHLNPGVDPSSLVVGEKIRVK